MMRSLSTSALGQPSDTKPTLGAAGLARRLLDPALVGADAAVLMARGFYRPGAPGATRLAGARGPEPRPPPLAPLWLHTNLQSPHAPATAASHDASSRAEEPA